MYIVMISIAIAIILILIVIIVDIVKTRKSKPIIAIDVEVCEDSFYKDVVLQLKCKHCKKKFKALDRISIVYYMLSIDSICPYCNTYKEIRADVDV